MRILSFALAVVVASLAAPTRGSCDDVYVSMFQALEKPAPTAQSADLVALGKKLYHDPIMSLDQDISCNSCHNLKTYGVDNLPTSPGHKGQLGGRNSPTVYNAALHMSQFWDGRAKDVEEQALGPVLNPVEMAMPTGDVVIERLQAKAEYKKLFAKAFPHEKEAITFPNVGKAIGAFERTLVTPSRFDAYIKGDTTALNDAEKAGLKTFVQTGCVTCHVGSPLGGQMFQKMGLVKPYPLKDLGRYEVTKLEAEKYFFKVPSLRNIEKTGPYLHDGSVATLEDAVRIMAEYQLGKQLSQEETASIVTFLKSLTGELPQ